MAVKHFQIGRGTYDKAVVYTGLIGELILDTTNMQVRVHDGETMGGYPIAKDVLATSSARGLMAPEDKVKLDTLQNYVLPTAGLNTLGGVKTTSTVTSASGYTACPIISGVPYYANIPAVSLYIGAVDAKADAATSNGATYLKLFSDNTLSKQFNIKGSGATTVTSDASGSLIINSVNTTYTAATNAPLAPGTAAVGTSAKYAREDHVHPLQATISGNAGTATKLANGAKIGISGAVTGTATLFDGSADITIPTTGIDVSKANAGTLPVSRGGTGQTSVANIQAGKDAAGNVITNTYATKTELNNLRSGLVQTVSALPETGTEGIIYLVPNTTDPNTYDQFTWENGAYVPLGNTSFNLGDYVKKENVVTSLSISGRTITYTKGDGTTGTLTTQDNNTTYSAGTGLSLSGTTFSVASTAGSSALSWGTEVTLGTVGGLAIKAKLPANPNSDTKVTQNISTTSSTYPVLLTPTANANANVGASTAIFGAGIKANPSTGELIATKFTGALAGNANTATKATQDSAGQQINTTYIKGLSVSGKTITYTKGDGTTGTITTQDTNTTYSVATTSANGLMSAADKSKLDGLSNYVLPTAANGILGGVKTSSTVTSASGYTACPIIDGVPYYKDTNTTYTLSSLGIGNVKNYDQSKAISSITRSGTTFTYTCLDGTTGTFTQQDNNTTYSNFVKSGSGAKAGLVPAPSTTAGTTKYLREDGTWQVPPNTTYSVFVKSGSGAASGLVPAPSTTAGTTKYLREDGTWTVPPNTTYTFTAGTSTLAWNTEVTLATVGGVAIKAKLPANPHSSTATAVRPGNLANGAYTDVVSVSASDKSTNGSANRVATIRLTNGDGYNEMLLGVHNEANSAPGGISIKNTNGTTTTTIAGTTIGTFQGNLTGNVTGNVSGSSGSCTGNAATATKATQDSAGQQINTTYIKGLSVSGRTITYTKGDGTTGTITTQDNNTWTAFKGATSSAAGTAGYVPAPAAGDQTKFFRADGTWQVPPDTNTTYTFTAGTSTLAWNSEVTLATVGGLAIKAKLPANPNSDTKVTQNISTTNNTYPVLLTPTANATANVGASTAIFGSGIKANPSTGELVATKFTGTFSGTATKATQDSAGQQINTTYIKGLSVSGKTITYTKGDGTTGTITTQDTNTTYSVFVKSGSGAAAGLVPAPSTTAGTTKYLREDGTWQVPPDTNTTYSNFVKSGSGAKAGLVPAPSTTAGTTKYLREDGTWQVPPNTTYSFTAGTSTLAWNTEVTLATVGGVAIKAKLPANPNSDTKVTQNISTTNNTYPVLLTPTANATANVGANTAIFGSGIKANPSTGELVATKFTGALSGNAATATKLATARTIALSGAVTGSKTFDGSGNITISTSLKTCYVTVEGEAVTNNIFKFATADLSGSYNVYSFYILIQSPFFHRSALWYITIGASATAGVFGTGTSQLINSIDLDVSNFFVGYKNNSGSAINIALYCKVAERYNGYRFTIISETKRGGIGDGSGAYLILTNKTKDTGTAAVDSGFTVINTTNATVKDNISGNAATATKATQDSAGQQINTTYIKGLSVSGRTITYTKGNGTTGTITTQDNNTTYSAGTGLTLSGTTFSVTANTYAAASHSHNYLPLTGGTLTGQLIINRDNSGVGGGLRLTGASQNFAISIINTGITKGTAPTAVKYGGIDFYGTTVSSYKNRVGMIEYMLDTNNVSSIHLRAYNCTSAENTATSTISAYVDGSGNAYTAAPTPADNDNTTKIATTAWVQKFCGTTKKYLTSHQSLSNYSTLANTIKSLSINGKTITYTKGDNTTGTLTTQDNNTTYSAGTGLTLSGTTFSVTANTYAAASHTHNYLPLTGGTLTGGLSIANAGITARGTKPTAWTNRDIRFLDGSTNALERRTLGWIRCSSGTGGEINMEFKAFKPSSTEDTASGLVLTYPYSGNPYINIGTAVNIGDAGLTVGTGGITTTGSVIAKSTGAIFAKQHSTFVKGTNPSANTYWTLTFCDKNGTNYANNCLGMFETYVNSAGLVTTYMRAMKNEAGSSSTSQIACYYDTTNNLAYTSAPTPATGDHSTKIATTAWVHDNALYTKRSGMDTWSFITSSASMTNGSMSGATSMAFAMYASNSDLTTNLVNGKKIGGIGMYAKDGQKMSGLKVAFYTSTTAASEVGFDMFTAGSPGSQKTSILFRHGGHGEVFGPSPSWSSALSANADTGTVLLGSTTYLWKQVCAKTSSIATSDERLKTQIAPIPDEILDAWGDLQYAQFKWIDTVEQEGEAARLHVGAVAQAVERMFQSKGIDVTKYSFFCHTPEEPYEWTEEVEVEPGVKEEKVVKGVHPDRYALRYADMLVIEAVYQRRRADRLEARLARIEKALNLD